MAKSARTKTQGNGIRILAPGEGAPNALVAEVEVPVGSELLKGMKLVGIRVWRRKDDGELFVSFPGRTYETADGTRQFDYVRALDGLGETAKATRLRILDACKQLATASEGKEAGETK